MTARSEIPNGARAHPPAPLEIAVEAQRGTVTIAPKGEVDLATSGQLRREITRVIDAGPARMVIDLRGVEFLDSTGLHSLLEAHAQTQRDNRELSIIPGPEAVQRLFEITGTIDRLPFANAAVAAENGHALTQ